MSKKPASGGARLRASGRTPVLIGLTAEQREILAAAAEIDNRPLTQFLVHHGLAAALKIIKNKS